MRILFVKFSSNFSSVVLMPDYLVPLSSQICLARSTLPFSILISAMILELICRNQNFIFCEGLSESNLLFWPKAGFFCLTRPSFKLLLLPVVWVIAKRRIVWILSKQTTFSIIEILISNKVFELVVFFSSLEFDPTSTLEDTQLFWNFSDGVSSHKIRFLSRRTLSGT